MAHHHRTPLHHVVLAVVLVPVAIAALGVRGCARVVDDTRASLTRQTAPIVRTRRDEPRELLVLPPAGLRKI